MASGTSKNQPGSRRFVLESVRPLKSPARATSHARGRSYSATYQRPTGVTRSMLNNIDLLNRASPRQSVYWRPYPFGQQVFPIDWNVLTYHRYQLLQFTYEQAELFADNREGIDDKTLFEKALAHIAALDQWRDELHPALRYNSALPVVYFELQ